MSCAKAATIEDRLAVDGNEEPPLRLGPSMSLGSDEYVGELEVDESCTAKLLGKLDGDGRNKFRPFDRWRGTRLRIFY
ncbi:unnamed protein product [Lasius platythorax]|uniref:Uncharacterized protein n=1 Tax=Lasius platythorax TaxID=488582 RepID=A0AAV2NIZ2_9HYME